jgi:hypothetical protein
MRCASLSSKPSFLSEPLKAKDQCRVALRVKAKSLMGATAENGAAGKCFREHEFSVSGEAKFAERQFDPIVMRAVRIEIDHNNHDIGPVR